MARELNDVSIIVNNEKIGYVPNSLSMTYGFGESELRTVVVGNGIIDHDFSEDLESRVSMVKFSLRTTSDNINKFKVWKGNRSNNALRLVGASGTGFDAFVTSAAIMNDPEINFQSDGQIEIEFKGNQAQ